MTLLIIALLVVALLLTPLGAPGNWIMIAIIAACAWFNMLSATVLLVCVIAAAIAEVLEFVIVRKLTGRYGGSRKAFWGAIAGGIVGVIIGMPIPVVGSLIAGFAGTFIGAAAITYMELRDVGQAGRVGWGVLIGRMLAAAVKTAAGVAILITAAAALIV